MKKVIIISVSLMALLLAGCGSSNYTQAPVDQPTEETSSSETNQIESAESETVTVEAPPYEIVSVKEDKNVTYGTRFDGMTYQVYVVSTALENDEQVKAVCIAAAEEVKSTYPEEVDAILVFPYDYAEYIGHGHVFGYAVLKYDGTWDWSNLREKDWSQRLTPEEVEVWAAWQELIKQKHEENPDELPDEDAVTEEVAKEFGITADEVSEIMMKQTLWSAY